jgi:hypothetical protein
MEKKKKKEKWKKRVKIRKGRQSEKKGMIANHQ